ncbi:MAG: hypothetical protein ACO39R_01345 [Pontimonas sp.]
MSLSLITRGVVIGALALSLSACQALDSLVGGLGDQEAETVDQTAETTDSTVEDAPAETTEAETAEVTPERGPVPSCDAMYSDAQVVAFTEEGRVSEGDISADGYGYGTTNPDLVAVLAGVRNDLRISCTWYLPPEFSSTTSMAILSAEAMAAVEGLLGEVADSQTALGGGQLWKLESSSSNISGEYIANESHYIVDTPCPSSLAETSCKLWVGSTNSAGSSEELTRDAATVFGALD